VPQLRSQALLLAALVLWIALPAAASASSGPIAGTALWVDQVPAGASPESIAATAALARARTLYLKAADGVTPEPQFSAALVAGLRAEGLGVCAWVFAYGAEPLPEAQAAIAAVRAGAGCLVVDAEGAYEKRYGQAQSYVQALRAALGAGFPIALAGQPEILEHPRFPYSVFLGPGGFGFDMPLLYWRDLGLSVAGAYADVLGMNAIYGRPIVPVGQLYGEPTVAELEQFRQLASSYGLAGTSFFDLDSANSAELGALAAAVPRRRRRAVAPATVRPGADGDEVDWAQELLNAAGAKLPVGGYYGAETAHAVGAFQRRHHLPVSGVLGAATWRALLRLHAREPSWAAGPPDSAG
jgi:Putative peptidoglycan binding domain